MIHRLSSKTLYEQELIGYSSLCFTLKTGDQQSIDMLDAQKYAYSAMHP
jgi:hypothetical protein